MDVGLTWSAGGAPIETGTSHLEKVRSSFTFVESAIVTVIVIPARWYGSDCSTRIVIETPAPERSIGRSLAAGPTMASNFDELRSAVTE